MRAVGGACLKPPRMGVKDICRLEKVDGMRHALKPCRGISDLRNLELGDFKATLKLVKNSATLSTRAQDRNAMAEKRQQPDKSRVDAAEGGAQSLLSRVSEVAHNYGAQFAGQIAGDACLFALFVFISRKFGPEPIGQYSFAMGIASSVGVFGSFGLNTYTLRELGARRDDFRRAFGEIISLRMALSAAVYVLVLIALLLLPSQRSILVLIALIVAYQLCVETISNFGVAFIAMGNPWFAAWLKSSSRVGASLLAIGAGVASSSFTLTVAAMPVAMIVTVAVGALVTVQKYGMPSLGFEVSKLADLVRSVVSYGVSAIVNRLRQRLDVTLLGLLAGSVATGEYNVAYKIAFICTVFGTFFGTAVLPTASRLHEISVEKFSELHEKSLNLSFLLGIPAAAGLFLVSGDIIHLFYGDEFMSSVPVLRVLSGLLLLAFPRVVLGTFLTASGNQSSRTRAEAWTLLFVGIALVIGVLAGGALGAATAIVSAEAFLTGQFAVRLLQVVTLPRVDRLLIGSMGSAAFMTLHLFVVEMELIGTMVTSVAVYGAVLLVFPQVRRSELSLLKEMTVGKKSV